MTLSQPSPTNPTPDPSFQPQGWNFDLEIHSQARFRFGLPGFEHLNQFVIAVVKDFPPFHLLISQDEPQVNLLIIRTELLGIYRSIEIPPAELKKVGAGHREDIESYVVVKVNQEKNSLTANLRAPILIHRETKAAYQAILDRKDLAVDYPLVPA
ncbi:MAG: flagellar assembly protein FliW [Candidatus Neomarinimicrobiota bacterium]|nr:MAG: flagellar assembly protein FliW [Candidatus Neomarinimicrobiota bacterium]